MTCGTFVRIIDVVIQVVAIACSGSSLDDHLLERLTLELEAVDVLALVAELQAVGPTLPDIKVAG